MMTNTVAQSIFLLLLWSLVKGIELNHFSITDIECIEGNVSVSIICTVPNPQNMIIIYKDGAEITSCTTYPGHPYMHCTNSSLKDVIASSTVMNNSMIFQIESAETEFLLGKWVCQNGGLIDPSWRISFPNITCPPQSHCAPKSNCPDDMVKRKRVADIFMMLAPLIGCGVLTFITIPAKKTVLRVMCVVVCLVYSILSILIIENDMDISATIGLTIFCLLIGIAFAILAVCVIRKTK